MRQLLQSQDLNIGQRYFFKQPAHKCPAQGLAPRMGAADTEWPAEGKESDLTDYVYGCVRRGSLLAFESDQMVADREKVEAWALEQAEKRALPPPTVPDPTGGPTPDAPAEESPR